LGKRGRERKRKRGRERKGRESKREPRKEALMVIQMQGRYTQNGKLQERRRAGGKAGKADCERGEKDGGA
jgi:hypothetical protein